MDYLVYRGQIEKDIRTEMPLTKDNYKNAIWYAYCRYCHCRIRSYTYEEILYDIDNIPEKDRYCCKKHQFLYALKGE